MKEKLQAKDTRHRIGPTIKRFGREAGWGGGSEATRRSVGQQGLQPIDGAVATAIAESHRDILRFLRRRMGDAAEEVLRAFFIKALDNAAHLPHAESLRLWLGHVLQSVSIEHYRKGSPRTGLDTGYQASVGATVLLDEEFDAAVCACLYKLLPTLKPEYAEILWRADLTAEPRECTAKLLSTTPNNIGVRLYRARTAFRKRLEQMCLTCPIHGFFECTCPYANRMQAALSEAKVM